MEQLCIGAILVLALVIIVNRVRKLFNQDCGECSLECNSCCQSAMPQPRVIELDRNGEE